MTDFQILQESPLYTEADKLQEETLLSVEDAFIKTINESLTVNPLRIAALSAHTPEEVLKLLAGTLVQDPAAFRSAPYQPLEGWCLLPQYLNGDLAQKLNEAQAADKKYPGVFRHNIEIIQNAMPKKISFGDISVMPGAPYLRSRLLSEFLLETLHLVKYPLVTYNEEKGEWKVENINPIYTSQYLTHRYGIPEKNAFRIFECLCNGREVDVFEYPNGPGGKRVLNERASQAARGCRENLMAAWKNWLNASEARMDEVEECYNRFLDSFYSAPYDGSFLSLPDLNPTVSLKPQQKNALARILLSGQNILLAHRTGSGKSFLLPVAAHELKRLGLSRKIMLVTPNATLEEMIQKHRLFYPNDCLLVLNQASFAPAVRDEVLARVRDKGESYSCIYCSSSTFDLIRPDKKRRIERAEAEIARLNKLGGKGETSLKKEKLRKASALQKKLDKFKSEEPENIYLPFEDLGIDCLILDESHLYRNTDVSARSRKGFSGHAAGCRKANDLYVKADSVDRLIFSTGTVIVNSMADLFTAQMFLQRPLLQSKGLHHLNSWLLSFAEYTPNTPEIAPDGRTLHSVDRIKRFTNLPELRALLSSSLDFYFEEEQTESSVIPKCETVYLPLPCTAAQKAFFRELAERADHIHRGEVLPSEDNPLRITVQGRLAALHPRLVGLDDDESPKLDACAEKLLLEYKAHPGMTQLVFCDSGVPKAGSSFSLYDALKQKLVAGGIRADEVAFVHDASGEEQLAALFARFNSGLIRILIGTSAKMGIGVNLQTRCCALHELDLPWVPATLTQREARIKTRPGNLNASIRIYVYISSETFDPFILQTLQNKQESVWSFMAGMMTDRQMDDVGETVLSLADAKALALGNGLVRDRIETETALRRAEIASVARQNELRSFQAALSTGRDLPERLRSKIQNLTADEAAAGSASAPLSREERNAFGEELLFALTSCAPSDSQRLFDSYREFKIYLPAAKEQAFGLVFLIGPSGDRYALRMTDDAGELLSPIGCTQRIDAFLKSLSVLRQNTEERLKQSEENLRIAACEIARGNPYPEEIDRLSFALQEIDRRLEEEKQHA